MAQGDLLLVVAQGLGEERFGVGPVAFGALLPPGVEVDELAGMSDQLLVPQDAADAPGGRPEGFRSLAGQGGLGAPGDDVQAASAAPCRQQAGEHDQGVGARPGVVAQGGPVARGEGGGVEVPQVQDGPPEGSAVAVEVGEEAAQTGVGRGVHGVRRAVGGGGVGGAPAHQAAAFAAGGGQGGEGVRDAPGVGENQPAVVPRGCGGAVARVRQAGRPGRFVPYGAGSGGRRLGGGVVGGQGRAVGPDGFGEPGVDRGAGDGGGGLLDVGGSEALHAAQRCAVVGVQGDVAQGGVPVAGEQGGVGPEGLVADGFEGDLVQRERQPDPGPRGGTFEDERGQQGLEAGVEEDGVEVVARCVVADGAGRPDPGQGLPGPIQTSSTAWKDGP